MHVFSVRALALLAAVALPILGQIQPVAAALPLKQYVCRVDVGPLAGQAVLITAATSPGMHNPCSDGQGNSGQVIFEYIGEIRQYVCDFTSGPLAGQLKILSGPPLPARGAACNDGSGNAGTVVFVEDASSPTQPPPTPTTIACTTANQLRMCSPATGTGPQVCRNVRGDPDNCGACGNKCTGTTPCNQGQCSGTTSACPTGLVICAPYDASAPPAACRNLQDDPNNCSICGTKCPAGQVCHLGVCKTPI